MSQLEATIAAPVDDKPDLEEEVPLLTCLPSMCEARASNAKGLF